MNKIVRRILNIILIITIIVLALYFVLRFTNQIYICKVKTGSMEDNIHVGDYILTIHKNEYHVGDVVTFKKGNGFITHRIVKIEGDEITTKGDANNIEDKNINRNIIVGKVILSGGILNIIITYKYALVAAFLSIYLFSCYFGKKELIIDKRDEKKLDKNKAKRKKQI